MDPVRYLLTEVFNKLTPEGWRFHSADASILGRVSVMFIRDEPGRKWWHGLTEEEQEEVSLYANGLGGNIDEAILDARLIMERARKP